MPAAAITAVADWLADFESGRAISRDGHFFCREKDERQIMARFASTCRGAYESLKQETRLESEYAADDAVEEAAAAAHAKIDEVEGKELARQWYKEWRRQEEQMVREALDQ